ncbi:hypothetical protein Cadr_000020907 [Camelus dromedarius]|uniref:Uncharacterized protein n=1 Tax=Camelus dromedarius TaxID=9838 RepID=A0A5N4CUE0_CAMDR|nr:hypothetical protein Cadr_000020907 [Camelus dromedarius]
MSREAAATRPDLALTLLCPLQTDCALWTVQLQRELPGQAVGGTRSAEPAALHVDAALRLRGERGPGLRALLRPEPGCPRVRRAFQLRATSPTTWPRPCLVSRRISSELHSNLPKSENSRTAGKPDKKAGEQASSVARDLRPRR